MSSIVYLKNKTNGKTYAYLNESVWDSETGKCKCKRKCLGHLDPVTGDIVPYGLIKKSKPEDVLAAFLAIRRNYKRMFTPHYPMGPISYLLSEDPNYSL